LSCRLRRVDELARFAILYADTVYIDNYFDFFFHEPTNPYEEYSYRTGMAGDLKIINRLKPLLTSGLIRFIQPMEPGYHLCPKCTEQRIPTFKTASKNLRHLLTNLNNTYSSQTSVTLSTKPYAGVTLYQLDVEGPDDLFEERGISILTEDLPPVLSKKIQAIPSHKLSQGIPLSKDDIRKSGIISTSLEVIPRDIWVRQFLCNVSGMNLKYLTNRDIDRLFLEAATESSELKAYNDVIHNHIVYELPLILDMPFQSLLDVRQTEHDAFLVFRDSINEVVSKYVLSRKQLSTTDASQIYFDLVQPKLNQLNKRIASIRSSKRKTAARDAAVAIGLLTFGFCSSFLTPALQAVTLSLAGIQSLKTIGSVTEAVQIPEDIRNDNFYFLWKLAKKLKST